VNLTLWDLLSPVLPRALRPAKPELRSHGERSAAGAEQPGRASSVSKREKPPDPARPVPPRRRKTDENGGEAVRSPQSAAHRYEAVTRIMLDRYEIRVRKWRSSMSGVAWYVTYRDGNVARLIEAPRPKGPMSAAVFLHEIGHHAIGFNRYRPRCLEEYHAWAWAIAQMEAHGITVTDSVRHRMHQSLHYAVQKARRRGLKVIPGELHPYCAAPPKRRNRMRTYAVEESRST
jgi:hypothetical protein